MAEASVEYVYATPFGHITIASNGDAVTKVAIGTTSFGYDVHANMLTNLAAEEILEYTSGKRAVFDVPIRIEGTDFQKSILRAIEAIPYSQTRTSREVAELAGYPGTQRQVGSVVRNNPIAILIPTHRLVSASGYYNKNDKLAKINAALRELEKRFS